MVGWKLLHKLFGWEYADIKLYSSYGIRRVHTAPNGIKYFCHGRGVIFLDNPGTWIITIMTPLKE